MSKGKSVKHLVIITSIVIIFLIPTLVTAELSITSENDRNDELRGLTLRFARQLSGRTTGFIRGLIEKRNFIGDGLSSEVTSYRYSFETSLSYRLTSRFTANVGYNYNTEKSSRVENEYSNNVLWVRIGVNLPELQKIIK